MKKIRIIVVSYLPWRDDTNVGNTLSNLFDGLQDKVEIASIYFKGGKPQNKVTKCNFYIPEKELAKSIITRKKVGCQMEQDSNKVKVTKFGVLSKAYNKARVLRWDSLLLFQDLIGLLGEWNSDSLNKFVETFHPDIVFGPLGRVPVANLLMIQLHKKFRIPVVAYAWDDHYSLQKKSYSPIFWVKTFLERFYIKKCAKECDFLYTITSPMKDEYSRYFKKLCKILYKSYSFNIDCPCKKVVSNPINIIYMGNIGGGRWQVLENFAKSIKKINNGGVKALLKIYTMSPLDEKINRALNIHNASEIMPPVASESVLSTMSTADILIHVEPSIEKDRLFYRLSFSTKLVDYFFSARCIVAAGGETASIRYLKDNNAALVIEDPSQIERELERLINDPSLILDYGMKAWNCGIRNHNRNIVQNHMYDDFCRLVETRD